MLCKGLGEKWAGAMSVKPLTHGAGSVAPPGLGARGRRGPRAPFGRPGLRIPRSYGANNGGPEGRGCLAPGAVPARRAGTSPGSAAGPARQAPPGAPGILEGPVGRPMRFRAHSLTHGRRAILTEGIVVKGIRPKTGARHECKISYSWRARLPTAGAAAGQFDPPTLLLHSRHPPPSGRFAAEKAKSGRPAGGCRGRRGVICL